MIVAVASAARVVAVLAADTQSGLAPARDDGPVVLIELRPDALAKVAAAAAQGPLGFGFR